jgi:dihydropyrimidinase
MRLPKADRVYQRQAGHNMKSRLECDFMSGEASMQTKYDVVVKDGLVIGPRRIRRVDVGIKAGEIASLAPGLGESDTTEVIDASGQYILPGLLDVHVHPVYVDTIADCSLLGAFGGITTMIHYAYARPGKGLADTVEKFIDEGKETSYTDFAIHAAMFDPENQIRDMEQCVEMGVNSFKMFMTYAKLGWMTDDYFLAKAMDVIAQLGGLAVVHAEDGLSIDYLEDKYRNEPLKEAFLKMRPDALEADAVFRAISIAEVMDCPLYIAHISAARGLDPIRTAREKGQLIYTETCPQYLCLTDQTLQEKGPLAKIGPPLRTAQDSAALWEGLKSGLIDVIASDHAPKDKKIDDDFFEAPFGAPSSETMFPVVYQRGINEGSLDLCTIIRALSETPAKIFGLYPRKGVISEGSDADLVIFDPNREHTITQASQHSNAPYTLYEGWKCLGIPHTIMQSGKIIVQGGEMKGKRGQGRFMPTEIKGQSDKKPYS